MSNISTERLEEFIHSPLENSLTRGEQMEMARELLEYRKASAQPVAWTDAEELRDASKGGVGYLFAIGATANKFSDPRRQIMLYTAPQITGSDASKNPVGEVVAWGENIPPRQGINRKVDFRWLDVNVEPGTLLYAAPQPDKCHK